MLVASLDYDTHRGRIAIGRVIVARSHRATPWLHITDDGEQIRSRVTWLGEFDGLGPRRDRTRRTPAISSLIAGFGDAKIGATLVDPSNPEALPTQFTSKSRR